MLALNLKQNQMLVIYHQYIEAEPLRMGVPTVQNLGLKPMANSGTM